jgi:DNA-binding XRE family transcriptional regulator
VNFAEAVRRHRAIKNWSQETLALRAGLSRQGIINIENGNNPRWRIAKTLSLLLGFSLDSLSL